MEQKADIIIVGAGICGLSIALQLSHQGKSVIILEARNRVGGRICTSEASNGLHFEAGAEFFHGESPITKELIKRAGGHLQQMNGKIYSVSTGQIREENDFIPERKKVIEAFSTLKTTNTLSEFLSTHFTATDELTIRQAIIRQAEGFDVADPDRISLHALRDEWDSGDNQKTWQIKEGYGLLVEYLKLECLKAGCLIYISQEVKEIHWRHAYSEVICTDHSLWEAGKVIITVPLGVLTANQDARGNIEFVPGIPDRISAARDMGFGGVIKIILVFKSCFWSNTDFAEYVKQLPDMDFLINEGCFPVYWAGKNQSAMLTAWAGGPQADKISDLSNTELLELAIKELSGIMNCNIDFLKQQLFDYEVHNWCKDPYTYGAYSYCTTDHRAAVNLLTEPLASTLYFAGEAFGKSMGTVEAALQSADETCRKVIRDYANHENTL